MLYSPPRQSGALAHWRSVLRLLIVAVGYSGRGLRRRCNLFILLSMVSVCGAGKAEAASPGAPINLRCEYLTNSLRIDTATPRLSWVVVDSDLNETQTAYQILVASSQANIASDYGDMLDSGQTLSNQQYGVKYNGAALSPMTQYWWKARTCDKDGNVSPWSDVATFETAMFGIGDWPSQS